jgi:hypothetical protein
MLVSAKPKTHVVDFVVYRCITFQLVKKEAKFLNCL